MSDDYSGLFVVFEGGEGSGKSTQSKKLADALMAEGIPCLLTYEPGGSRLGYKLRQILLESKDEPISKRAEALLFMADRAEHVEKVILPALREGRVVISDRYIASTMAYQAYAGGLPTNVIEDMSQWASGYLLPEITFYLDVDPALGLRRTIMRGKRNHFEAKSLDYHELVRKGFLRQSDDTWVLLDSRDPIYTIQVDVLMRVKLAVEAKTRHLEEVVNKSLLCPGCGFLLFEKTGLDATHHS